MHLSDLWFIAIAVLWAGYFVLEGFDFGVGILLPFLGRDNTTRRVVINTIGPVWDGNEVWLLTAGGATFAAFPAWYASMFSSFYLPLLLVLVALIIRGVAFEYRGKRDNSIWRHGWDAAIFLGSLLPAILWGVAFGNVLRGIPLNAEHNFTGNFFTFLNPYALVGGLATLTLFTLHGALFLALKTTGDLRRRAKRAAAAVAVAAIVAGGGFLAWTEASHRSGTTTGTAIASVACAALAAAALIAAVAAHWAGREGIAFAANATAIAGATAALFTALYPNVLPSTTSAAYSLTTANAASAAKTLIVMTVVAIIFLPFVLAYQAWTYWVFRKRVKAS
ncbi:cytochrome d ubiquinol oxidase subunit II [Trebonia sp.]|uniref:cytochrome d ubiquinol oxidase subunit II n=1 Tax=Trebonia sp. TaxID=2767075 RepID=UPI00262FFB70|nr:cytochrome d ubiquinol oxidase subunit II [Trebonia sp.]